MVVLLAVVVLAFPVMRGYALRVERSGGDKVDQLHRLRRGGVAFSFVYLLLVGVAMVELRAERHALRALVDAVGRPLAVALGIVLLLVLVLGPTMAVTLAVRPSYERLRGIHGTTRNVRRRLLRALVVMLLPQAVWFAAYITLLRQHAHWAVLVVVFLAYLLFLTTVTPALVMASLPTRAPDEHTRELVRGICDRLDVRIRGVRVIDTANNPTTNAMFAGFGFGPKYIFLTDQLVDSFSDEEVTAVVAHEIGHRKHHDVGRKLMARLGSLVVAMAALVGLLVLGHHSGMPRGVAAVAVVVIPLLVVLLQLLVQGTQGIRLERKADDYAVDAVGPDAVRRALVKLTEQNMMKQRTGRLWNIMTQHPGMDSRIERLEQTAAHVG